MKLKARVEIAAPIEKVFDAFTDLEIIEENLTGVQSIEVLEGPSKMVLGTKWKETRMFLGKEATEVMTVAEIQQNRRYVVTAASHGMEYVSTYTFEPGSNGIVVTMLFTGKPITLGAKLATPLGLLFKGSLEKEMRKDMEELKRLVEGT